MNDRQNRAGALPSADSAPHDRRKKNKKEMQRTPGVFRTKIIRNRSERHAWQTLNLVDGVFSQACLEKSKAAARTLAPLEIVQKIDFTSDRQRRPGGRRPPGHPVGMARRSLFVRKWVEPIAPSEPNRLRLSHNRKSRSDRGWNTRFLIFVEPRVSCAFSSVLPGETPQHETTGDSVKH